MKLYDYQIKYLAGLPRSCIMAADLGTGKTLMSLAHWDAQRTGRPLLIVAPASKIRTGDWEYEVRRWFGDKLPDITYMSYETLRLLDTKTHKPRWWQFVAARNGGIVYDVIADECAALKNPQAKQSKAVYEITRSGGLFIGLSGNPMPNGWIDFAGYSKLFNFTYGITEFKRKYCIYQDFKGFPELVRYTNVDQLQNQLKRVAYKLSRDQAKELPARQIIPINIHMPKKAVTRYQTMKITRQDPASGEVLDTLPRLLSLLRQSTTDARMDNLLSIIDDTSDNVVIFYNYISERKKILKALAKTDKMILRLDGEHHSGLPAPDADIKNTVLLAHYKSASTGLNLQWANVTVYFSPCYSWGEFEQSMGRTHRTGQTKKCVYYLFNVKNTVDRDIWNTLKRKQDFSATLWGETLKEEQKVIDRA